MSLDYYRDQLKRLTDARNESIRNYHAQIRAVNQRYDEIALDLQRKISTLEEKEKAEAPPEPPIHKARPRKPLDEQVREAMALAAEALDPGTRQIAERKS